MQHTILNLQISKTQVTAILERLIDEKELSPQSISNSKETMNAATLESHINEFEKDIEVISERSEEPQKESKEDQPLMLVKPPTLPSIYVEFKTGVVVKERLQIFYTADTFVSDNHDARESYVLEVPNELLNLNKGMPAELPKAIDVPFIVDILKGKGIMSRLVIFLGNPFIPHMLVLTIQESVEVNEVTPIEDYWSEPEEIIEVSLHEPDISIARNEADEAEKEIDVILERPEERQKRSKEDQPLVLVTPPTLPCLPVKFTKGVVIKERLQIFYMADTFVLDYDDAIDSYVLEVPDELLNLKEGMPAELSKAIDAPFVVDIT
ncbi:hypothetical protein Sjap_002507 [Stephania japonica]|uniref:Uncharacterized protein n=1 Tax=Stephania japonica TaxID=461633 RepID=A0AAP0KP59_9MAGN